MASPNLQQIHDDLISVAMKAGEMILAANPSSQSSGSKKNSVDLVTETDQAVEKMVSTTLRSKYPDYEFMGEETYDYKNGTALTGAPTFVVDPIDGTTNFVHAYPYVSISLGFTHNLIPHVGVVYAPFTGLLYTAIRGAGAFVRSTKPTSLAGISPEPRRLPLKDPAPPLDGLGSALCAIEWGSDRAGQNWELKVATFAALGTTHEKGGSMVHGFRSFGSAALNLCGVASGELDLYWEGGAYAWDVCAGWVILEEAGGKMVDANPRKKGGSWEEWRSRVDERTYFAVRKAKDEEMKDVVEGLWAQVKGRMEYGLGGT